MLGRTPVSCHVALVVTRCGCAAVPTVDRGRGAGAAGPKRSLLAVPAGVGNPQVGGSALAQWPQLGMALGATVMEPGMSWLTFLCPFAVHVQCLSAESWVCGAKEAA